MNYRESINYLYKHLPMYQRIGAAAYKTDLDNTISLLNETGNPQNLFTSIHVAGTNGKGSVSHCLASILQEAGYKVGLYTSPHLKTFRERIRINGVMIERSFVARFVEKNRMVFDVIRPSFFEMTVAMAFQYFACKKVDIAIIETGLGGRLDSTNVIRPELSIITNISFDHTQFLGNTIPLIANEKAGIIKDNIPVVIGESHSQTKSIFIETAKQHHAPITFADQIYQLKNIERVKRENTFYLRADIYHKNGEIFLKDIISPLTGFYQEKNILTVAAAFDFLASKYQLTKESFWQGIKNCVKNTGFMGRWQCLQAENPLCIADVAHNEEGIKTVCRQIASLSYSKLHIVLGVVNDKDIETMLKLLPKEAVYYFCKAKIPRGLKAAALKQEAKKHQLYGNCYRSVKAAYKAAKANAAADDLVFTGGSIFTVAEVL